MCTWKLASIVAHRRLGRGHASFRRCLSLQPLGTAGRAGGVATATSRNGTACRRGVATATSRNGRASSGVATTTSRNDRAFHRGCYDNLTERQSVPAGLLRQPHGTTERSSGVATTTSRNGRAFHRGCYDSLTERQSVPPVLLRQPHGTADRPSGVVAAVFRIGRVSGWHVAVVAVCLCGCVVWVSWRSGRVGSSCGWW
jgi:hypothetical protein